MLIDNSTIKKKLDLINNIIIEKVWLNFLSKSSTCLSMIYMVCSNSEGQSFKF